MGTRLSESRPSPILSTPESRPYTYNSEKYIPLREAPCGAVDSGKLFARCGNVLRRQRNGYRRQRDELRTLRKELAHPGCGKVRRLPRRTEFSAQCANPVLGLRLLLPKSFLLYFSLWLLVRQEAGKNSRATPQNPSFLSLNC